MNYDPHNFSDFDPLWTAEQAFEAGADGPLSPFHRWAAWQMLTDYEKSFTGGHKTSLFAALHVCACHGLPMPDWVANAYSKGFHDWVNYRAVNLDDAFDVAIPKGKHANRSREFRILQYAIPLRIQEIHKSESRAIDESMFETVGREFNISGSKAKGIYYESWLYRAFYKNR